ncbi:uncharacterized protein LOC111108271 isoform X2 [Crassostrea virginica]
MANLFDRLQETFTLQNSEKPKDASSVLEKDDITKPHVTQEIDEATATKEDLVSAYTVNKQDGGKTNVVKISSQKGGDATKMKNESTFVIPKRKKDDNDILVDLMFNSREFQYEILPAIVKSYRTVQSSEKFKYTKVQSVHNRELLKQYLEKRKELRTNGYTDKEACDCVAFLCVEDEELVYKICRDGIPIGNYPRSCLGHPLMGVQLCKHADVIKPTPLHPNETGYLILCKIIKGRIKSVAESIEENPLEPTPHFDCHVISTPPDSTASPQSLFESSQVYMYEYGEEGVMQYPRNVCPVAVVSFVYEKDSRDAKSSSPRVHHPVHRGGSAPGASSRGGEGDQEFVVWSGSLTIKGLYACNVEMTSSAAFVKPAALGGQINISSKLSVKQVQQKYLRNVSGIRRSCEGYWNGYYVNACELRPVSSEGRSHFQRVMNYLGKHNAVAIQKLKKDVTLLMLTQSELTYQLGLSRPHQYPVLLYCIFLSKTSARKRLSHTVSARKDINHPTKLPHPPTSPPFSATKSTKSEDSIKAPQTSPFHPPSSPYPAIPHSPVRDYYRSPSSNIVSWPQHSPYGSPRNPSVPSTPQSPATYSSGHIPLTPPYGMPPSPHMSPGGALHAPFHGPYQGPEFHTPPRRSSRDSYQGTSYSSESKSASSFIPPNTFHSGPNFDPHGLPRPSFSPQSPHHYPPHPSDPRIHGSMPLFGNDLGFNGPRFHDSSRNPMQGPTFPERFDPNRSPCLTLPPSFQSSSPSDPRFNTPLYLKMHNNSSDPFHSPSKPEWSQLSPYKGMSTDRTNSSHNAQTTLHRSDPRLMKNMSPKVNPVAPMPRGSTSETHSSPSSIGMHSPMELSTAKMSPLSIPSPQQMPAIASLTPPPPQVPPPPPANLPEPPKPSRVSSIPVSYDSGFLYKPPASSLLQHDKVKRVFEEQCVAQEIQQRAKEAIKRHLLARSRIESKKVQEVGKPKIRPSLSDSKEKVAQSAEDMKQLLESSLDIRVPAKKKSELLVKKKEILRGKPEEAMKEKPKIKGKYPIEKLKNRGKHVEGRPKDKDVIKLKIPEPETFKLDSLEDIARMRKITEDEIKRESERQNMDEMEMEEDLAEEVQKTSKKRPKEREETLQQGKRCPSETDELSSKKAKIDTANDMKNFLNLSLEEDKPLEPAPVKAEVNASKRQHEMKKGGEGRLEAENKTRPQTYTGDKQMSTENILVKEKEAKTSVLASQSSGLEKGVQGKTESEKVKDKVREKQVVEETGGVKSEKPKDKPQKMETDVSDSSGRWDNPLKKKRQDSESDGERKIENQKGKIIIIKEIRMIRVNSDGCEIKSPEKDPENLVPGRSCVNPIPIPLEESSKVVEKKMEKQRDKESEARKTDRDDSKRREKDVKMDRDDRKKEKDGRRDGPEKRREKDRARKGESKDRRKSEDTKKHLVHYSDSESESSRSQSSSLKSRRSATPKSDDSRDAVPRYKKVYPDFKPGRPPAKFPKAAGASSSGSHSDRKPGDQRRSSLTQRARHQHSSSSSYDRKKGIAGISKRTDLQGKGKVKSVVPSRKDFRAHQAIIEGIITSAKVPLKKIPKIQTQKLSSKSSLTLEHASSSPLHISEDSKSSSTDVVQSTTKGSSTDVVQSTTKGSSTDVVQSTTKGSSTDVVQSTTKSSSTDVVQSTTKSSSTDVVQSTTKGSFTDVVQSTTKGSFTDVVPSTTKGSSTDVVPSTSKQLTKQNNINEHPTPDNGPVESHQMEVNCGKTEEDTSHLHGDGSSGQLLMECESEEVKTSSQVTKEPEETQMELPTEMGDGKKVSSANTKTDEEKGDRVSKCTDNQANAAESQSVLSDVVCTGAETQKKVGDVTATDYHNKEELGGEITHGSEIENGVEKVITTDKKMEEECEEVISEKGEGEKKAEDMLLLGDQLESDMVDGQVKESIDDHGKKSIDGHGGKESKWKDPVTKEADNYFNSIREKERTFSPKSVTVKKLSRREKDLFNLMNSFIPRSVKNSKEIKHSEISNECIQQIMRSELPSKCGQELGSSEERKRESPPPGLLDDLVDLEAGRDLPQMGEIPLTNPLQNPLHSNAVDTTSLVNSHLNQTSKSGVSKGKDLVSVEQTGQDSLLEQGLNSVQQNSTTEREPVKSGQAKRSHKVFSDLVHPGLDRGLVQAECSDEIQMSSGEVYEPDPDRVVQEPNPDRVIQGMPSKQDLKITVTNDIPVESKFKWISREQLVKDCIHGRHPDMPPSEVPLINAINSVIHKILPEKEGRIRSISTSDLSDTGESTTSNHKLGGYSDDEFVFNFEEESFQLEKSQVGEEDTTMVDNIESGMDQVMKESDSVMATSSEVEKIINLMKSQLEDSNDATSISSFSSSQTSYKSLSSSMNSQGNFEKALNDQLNSLSDGLDLLMQCGSDSLSFLTPTEGKELSGVIENTMRTLKASMQGSSAGLEKEAPKITMTTPQETEHSLSVDGEVDAVDYSVQLPNSKMDQNKDIIQQKADALQNKDTIQQRADPLQNEDTITIQQKADALQNKDIIQQRADPLQNEDTITIQQKADALQNKDIIQQRADPLQNEDTITIQQKADALQNKDIIQRKADALQNEDTITIQQKADALQNKDIIQQRADPLQNEDTITIQQKADALQNKDIIQRKADALQNEDTITIQQKADALQNKDIIQQRADPLQNEDTITIQQKADALQNKDIIQRKADALQNEDTITIQQKEDALQNKDTIQRKADVLQDNKTTKDETAFWSRILGFSNLNHKSLPSFSTPPRKEEEINEEKQEEDDSVIILNEDPQLKKGEAVLEVVVIPDSPNPEENIIIISSEGKSEPEEAVKDVLIISESPSTFEIEFSSSEEKDNETIVDERKLETDCSTRRISPIRFPVLSNITVMKKKCAFETDDSEEEIPDDNNNIEEIPDDSNNNIEASNTEKGRNREENPYVKLHATAQEKSAHIANKMVRQENGLKTESIVSRKDKAKEKIVPNKESVSGRESSHKEKTLTVIIPETKRKLLSQRQSPTLTVQAEVKRGESSPRHSPRIQSGEGKDKVMSLGERTSSQPPTAESQPKRRDVFSRLSPQINEDVKLPESVSPVKEVRTIQIGPSKLSKDILSQTVDVEKLGENKNKQSKEDSLVVITVSNERSEVRKKSRSKSPVANRRLSNYKPPPTSANAEPLSQGGPIRNKGKMNREERQYHPYRKEKAKPKHSWSFDIAYNSLRELMHDLTVSSYKSRHLRPKHQRTNSRFANYTFVRSDVPESIPGGNGNEEEVDDHFDENAIPDFEERKRKADLVDELTLGEQEEEDLTAEREVYMMEDSEQLDEEKVENTVESNRKIVPQMLANLPSRTVGSSTDCRKDQDCKPEKQELKLELDMKCSDDRSVVMKSKTPTENKHLTTGVKVPSSLDDRPKNLAVDDGEKATKKDTEQMRH